MAGPAVGAASSVSVVETPVALAARLSLSEVVVVRLAEEVSTALALSTVLVLCSASVVAEFVPEIVMRSVPVRLGKVVWPKKVGSEVESPPAEGFKVEKSMVLLEVGRSSTIVGSTGLVNPGACLRWTTFLMTENQLLGLVTCMPRY